MWWTQPDYGDKMVEFRLLPAIGAIVWLLVLTIRCYNPTSWDMNPLQLWPYTHANYCKWNCIPKWNMHRAQLASLTSPLQNPTTKHIEGTCSVLGEWSMGWCDPFFFREKSLLHLSLDFIIQAGHNFFLPAGGKKVDPDDRCEGSFEAQLDSGGSRAKSEPTTRNWCFINHLMWRDLNPHDQNWQQIQHHITSTSRV